MIQFAITPKFAVTAKNPFFAEGKAQRTCDINKQNQAYKSTSNT